MECLSTGILIVVKITYLERIIKKNLSVRLSVYLSVYLFPAILNE